MMSFRIRGLSAEAFTELFRMSDTELAHRYAKRLVADGPGFPCRISLTDASPGQTVILLNYEHHRVASPYRSSFAIFVRDDESTFDAIDEVPEQLRSRALALRGYDAQGMLRCAELTDGKDIEPCIDALFADETVAYLHAHFAKYGCYAARIERA
jgi:hypothetical protein